MQLFGTLVAFALILEILLQIIMHKSHTSFGGKIKKIFEEKFKMEVNVVRDTKWFFLAFVPFFIGFIIWILSVTGAPLCDPYSLFQGHAVWHFFSGLAPFLIVKYVRTEKPVHKEERKKME